MPGLILFWDAFWELTTERQIGMSEGRIPWRAVRQYALDCGFHSREDMAWFLAVIRVMDAEYLSIRSKKPGEKIVNEIPLNSKDSVQAIKAMLRRNQKLPDDEAGGP